jgi:hypothetical protein
VTVKLKKVIIWMLTGVLLTLSFSMVTIAQPTRAHLPLYWSHRETGLKQQTTSIPVSLQVAYDPAQSPRVQEIQGLMERTQTLERFVNPMNQVLALPEPITVLQAECGTVNAFYASEDRQIVMCYELVDYYLGLYNTHDVGVPTEVATVGALSFVLLHELGHAIVDISNTPVLGREEDAVDQFATIIMSRTEIGHIAAQAAAGWFYLKSSGQDTTAMPYWDEHSFDMQRFFNIMCLLYGSSPDSYVDLMQQLNIPDYRLERCSGEYAQALDNWMQVLRPYVRDL